MADDEPQLEFKLSEVCNDCESKHTFGWSEKCTHSDWHVIDVVLSEDACGDCRRRLIQWMNSNGNLYIEPSWIKSLYELTPFDYPGRD